MPLALIPTFVLYCFVSSITPGPANLCSLAAAMTYGRRQALLQWRGIFIGFAIVALCASIVVWFFGTALNGYISLLTYLGAAYILWLAWNILHSSMGETAAKPKCNFFTGLIVQLTNPKIMIYCITALTTYALPYADSFVDLLKITVLLPFTGPMCNLVWLLTGASLKKFFQRYQKPLNIAMSTSLAYCAVSILRM